MLAVVSGLVTAAGCGGLVGSAAEGGDAGVRDSAAEVREGGTSDAPTGPSDGPSPGEAGPPGCTRAPPVVVASGAALPNAPSLAVTSTGAFLTAYNDGVDIRYSLFDDRGPIIADKMFTDVGPSALPLIRTGFNLDVVVGYGASDGTAARPAFRVFAPASGDVTPATFVTLPGSAPPDVGGVATADTGYVVALRDDSPAPSPVHAIRFLHDGSLAKSESPAVTGTSVTAAWSQVATRYGVAFAATSNGPASIQIYTPPLAPVDTPVSFAPSVFADRNLALSMVGVADTFVVAWIEPRDGSFFDVVLAQLKAASGELVRRFVVSSATAQSVTRYYPHVVFDGAVLVVAWLERATPSSGDYGVWMARVAADLSAVTTPATCVSCNGPGSAPIAPFGLVAGRAGDYGLSYGLIDPPSGVVKRHYFSRVTCSP